MPALTVTDLDEGVIARLGDRARRHGRTVEDEVKAILSEAASPDDFWARAKAHREQLAASGRVFSDSADLLREDRDR